MKKKYEGVIVPTVTPLNPDLTIDKLSLGRMFVNFEQHGVIPFILGTTGEVASIPFNDKAYMIAVAGELKNHLPLYVGISSNNEYESIALAKLAAEAGAVAVVATLPSYYALTEYEMSAYFIRLADASPLPVIIYNIPATTHVSIPLEVVDKLSYHENIVGLKDSERSEERLRKSLELWRDREDFSHFVGWAAKSAEALLLGTNGIIPSTGNLYPKLYADLWNAALAGKTEEALALQKVSDELGAIYQANKTLGQSLWALKVLMQTEELCLPVVMPPVLALEEEETTRLTQTLNNYLEHTTITLK
ncbi:dihydrodipicolinate synthase family protein [Polluticaenibacter yanchengensis]|uniref:Dihydrodipicolinate synthase family protein n=1 Tax=Polluticaenibacter yanchengensis TaxID=3014562 RepID=A0ABT4UGD8_9BACT|nr:dihydrodipicolinate synthase family protein [Chitinophagaceae bacterium LY-5]